MAWEPDYITSAELKNYLRIDAGDTEDDTLIAGYVTTASRAVDTFCHRQFGQVAVAQARTYKAGYCRTSYQLSSYVYEIDDVQDLANFAVLDASGVAVTGYEFEPVNAIAKNKPYTRLLASGGGTLTVTGLWGWSSIPTPVKTATLIQASRFAARRDSPYGIAGSPSEGNEQRLLATLDPDLKTSLGSKYRREWWAL